jgi:hypothetical protein
MAKCNECYFDISLKSCEEAEVIECPSCGATYEVFRNKQGELDIKVSELADGIDWGE